MTLAQPDRASYRWLFIALAALAGGYCWYGITQYQRLNDLRQRQLSDAAAELTTTLETALVTLTEFDGKWDRWKAGNGSTQEPLVCDFDAAQPYLDLDLCATNDDVKWSNFDTVRFVTSPALGFQASGSDGARDTYFRFRADRLLQELAYPDSFPLIFVATGEGVVLYQEAPTRRRWVRRLRWGEQTFRDAHADRPPFLQIQSLGELVEGGATGWAQLRSASSRVSLNLGGTAHQVYLHPLVLDQGARVELIVGAAVPTTAIIREALALDTRLLGVLVFLLLLCVLGFPFVKLAFLDSHERFRLRDINRLYLSSGALLVLFTCAALAADGYARWRAVADEGLAALAGELEERFLDEVAAIRDNLAEYDRQVSGLRVTSCSSWPVHTEWFKDPDRAEPPRTDGTDPFRLPWPRRPIYLRQVAWIGPDGAQLWKSTTLKTPGKTNVGERPYFRAVRDGGLFTVRGEGPAVFLGPDRSITDGKFYTFVSLRSGVSETLCDELKGLQGTAVAAATTQLLSLDRQPLPAGYGFVLINREGRVLYHSDRRLSLRENLFEELSLGERARGVVFSGRSDTLTSRYREQPHELFFHPVRMYRAGETELAGFYLVTFRDTSAERTLVGHVFASGLAGPMMLLLGAYALAVLGIRSASRRSGQYWGAWLWPHGALHDVYKRQTFALVGLLLASIGAFAYTGSAGVFLLCAVGAAILSLGIYVHGRPRHGARQPLSTSLWQTSAVALALVCLVVAPTAALFQLALSSAFASLVATERASIERQKADVLIAAETEALSDYHARSRRDVRAADRRRYFSCVPAPYDAFDEWNRSTPIARPAVLFAAHAPGDAGPSDSPSLAGCRGAERNLSVRLHRAAVMGDADSQLVGAVRWVGDTLPIRQLTMGLPTLEPSALAYSPGGTLVRALPASGVALVAFGTMFGLLVWWIRWNTNRLFFASVECAPDGAPAKPIGEMWTALARDEQMVLLQVARERVANPYQRPVVDNLLRSGVLRLTPDLRPCSDESLQFLTEREQQLQSDLREWERVNVGHSWRYVRVILVASVAALACFLVATQPGLQSSLLAITTGITGALATALKMRDAITSWLTGRKAE